MIEALGYFSITLAANLYTPFILATIIAMFIGGASFLDRKEYNFGSVEYANATWRIWAAVQSSAIMWIIYAILASVPGPDYKYKEIVKTEKVEVASKYFDAYDECKDSMHFSNFPNQSYQEVHAFCDKKALQFVNLEPIVKVVPKEVIKYKVPPKEERYRTLFNTCMGKDIFADGWKISYDDPEEKEKIKMTVPELRNLRIKMCHDHAKEIVQ